MQNLQDLEIRSCHELKELPDKLLNLSEGAATRSNTLNLLTVVLMSLLLMLLCFCSCCYCRVFVLLRERCSISR
jgi:hypothetical protein